MPEPRTFTIALPAGLQLVNANDRLHWAKKARVVRELRKAAWACARRDRVPRLECARVVVEYQPPSASRARDAGNWAPTGKALIDGCRDAGVFPDDDSRHVVEESYRIGEPYPQGRMVLHVTEVLPGPGDAREMAALGKHSPRHAGSRLSGVRLTAKGDHHER